MLFNCVNTSLHRQPSGNKFTLNADNRVQGEIDVLLIFVFASNVQSAIRETQMVLLCGGDPACDHL